LKPRNRDDREEKITVVIPAYNEEPAIGAVVESILKHCSESVVEVIVVDDGSTDDTCKIASSLSVRVIRHDFNRGYGAAIKTGIINSSAGIIVLFDADGQYNPEDINRLLEHFPAYDMVVGARTDQSHQPLSRRPGKKVLSLSADLLAGTRIPDLNSGLRAFKREILLKYMHLLPSGFSFSSTSTFAFLKSDRRIKYIPVTINARIGESSVRQFRHGFQTILLMLRLVVLFEPLKIFLPASLFLGGTGFLSLIHDILIKPAGIADTTVLLLLSSILIFFFGLLTDQVSSLRREKHE